MSRPPMASLAERPLQYRAPGGGRPALRERDAGNGVRPARVLPDALRLDQPRELRHDREDGERDAALQQPWYVHVAVRRVGQQVAAAEQRVAVQVDHHPAPRSATPFRHMAALLYP